VDIYLDFSLEVGVFMTKQLIITGLGLLLSS